jgi:hypothetical protein
VSLLRIKWFNAKDIHKKMFPVSAGKRLARKAFHYWVEKLSQGRSKVTDDARPGCPVEIVPEVICSDGRIDSSWQEGNDRQCSNYTKVFPWFSIQHNAWSSEVSESVCVVVTQRTEG